MSGECLDFNVMAEEANRAVLELIQQKGSKHNHEVRARCLEYDLLNGYRGYTDNFRAGIGHPRYAVQSANPYDMYVDAGQPYSPTYMYAPTSKGNFEWQELAVPAEEPTFNPNWQF